MMEIGNIKKITEVRKSYNERILKELKDYLEQYPDIRFGQALINLNIIEIDEKNSTLLFGPQYKDPYNDEPITIYNRMRAWRVKVK
jgi:hypothetical protein